MESRIFWRSALECRRRGVHKSRTTTSRRFQSVTSPAGSPGLDSTKEATGPWRHGISRAADMSQGQSIGIDDRHISVGMILQWRIKR